MDRVQLAAIVGAVVLFGLFLMMSRSGEVPERGPAAPSAADAPGVPRESLDRRGASRPFGDDDAPLSTFDAVPDAPATGTQVPEKTAVIENDAVRMRIATTPVRVVDLELLEFADRKGEGSGPVELATDGERGTLRLVLGDETLRELERSDWQIVDRGSRAVELVGSADGVEVTRRFELDERGYGARVSVQIRNRSERTLEPRLELGFSGRDRGSGAPDRLLNYSLLAVADGEVSREVVQGIGSPGFFGGLFGGDPEQRIRGPVEVVGIDSQYFMLTAISDNPGESEAYFGPLGDDAGQALLLYGKMSLPPGTSVERSFRLYAGPKIGDLVAAVDARLFPLTDVGWHWVRPLVDVFATFLKWLHDNVVSNYGVAIIILTVLLRIAVYPLTQRSMKSMKRLGEIAPQMKEIQEKHKDEPDKLQAEMMKAYRERGLNPLSAMGGGCLPMLIQMPFMIALYFALQASIDLRHAPFMLWIDDLSAPENLFPGLPIPLRVLPIAMGVTMLLQQRLSPAPNADPQQRNMMQMMSIMFVVVFYGFASGLVLYWFVSNLLGIAQQMWVNRTPAEKQAG